MRKTKDSLNLECVLSDQEKLEYAKKLAQHHEEKSRAEDRLTEFKSQMKAEIDTHEAQINLLSRKVYSGKEYREVACVIEYDWDEKTKQWIRVDTGEVAKQDIISERELQEEMEVVAESKE